MQGDDGRRHVAPTFISFRMAREEGRAFSALRLARRDLGDVGRGLPYSSAYRLPSALPT